MTQGLDKGPILVTGASGGIGGATVSATDQSGYSAGCAAP